LFDEISSHSNIAFVVYCYGKYKVIKDDIIYNFQRYADKYNYDLIISEQENNYKYPWIKLNSFNLLDRYNWVITCDADMYISPSCPDIINFCTINSFNQILNTNVATSSLFVIGKIFQQYDFFNYNDDIIYSSIKNNCIKCVDHCILLQYRDLIDEECWMTRLLYKYNININVVNINTYTTNRSNMLLPRDCYRYNIIHFNSYNHNNMIYKLPEIYHLLDKRTDVNQLNKYILQQWGNIKCQ